MKVLVLSLVCALASISLLQAEKTVKPPSNEAIAAWNSHVSLSWTQGAAVLKVGPLDGPWQVAQMRGEFQARIMYWIAEPWYLSHGMGYGFSWDSDASKGWGRPGMGSFIADMGLGYMPRPLPSTMFTPGLEFRQAFDYSWIHYTNLSTVWLRSTLRPLVRLGGIHFELSLPLSISWRKDPMASFEYGLELGLVL